MDIKGSGGQPQTMADHLNRHNGVGTGTYITAPKEVITGKLPEATLAHELGHSADADKGISPVAPGMTPQNCRFPTRLLDEDENENRAVRTENLYNQGMGLPIRTDYGGRPVPYPTAPR
jgi:hypothetical protein